MILDLLVGSEKSEGVDLEKVLKQFEVQSANVVLGLDSGMSERRFE